MFENAATSVKKPWKVHKWGEHGIESFDFMKATLQPFANEIKRDYQSQARFMFAMLNSLSAV